MNPVEDIAYVRLSAPDLDLMEAFLIDFGLERAERTEDRLYMRGRGSDPVSHITERGEPGKLSFALRVPDRADLDEVAERCDGVVEARDELGGGFVVRLHDPDGNGVEIVQGITQLDSRHLRKPHAFNPGQSRVRMNTVVRDDTRPSQVLRLGHVALHAQNFPAMLAFYQDVLGMKISDSYYAGAPENLMAAFLHCGLGSTFVDHHTIALIGDGRPGLDHAAFEVMDFDDLMVGNRHLLKQDRWAHSWGVGRHRDGSQIFDYWRDPFGNKIEHWTDGDLVNDDYPSSSSPFSPDLAADQLSQWGPPLTPDFMR